MLDVNDDERYNTRRLRARETPTDGRQGHREKERALFDCIFRCLSFFLSFSVHLFAFGVVLGFRRDVIGVLLMCSMFC